jgi:hypothetical protein
MVNAIMITMVTKKEKVAVGFALVFLKFNAKAIKFI